MSEFEILPTSTCKEIAQSKIRRAWLAGLVVGIVTVGISLLEGTGYYVVVNVGYWGLVDAVIIFGLTFGIYKRNRIATILMLIFFVSGKILLLQEPELRYLSTESTFYYVSLSLGYFFLQGIMGTFAYHKLAKMEK